MADITELALGFIANFGLVAIFILLVLDGALLLPVFPGELVLILAISTYATDVQGLMLLIALATLASIVGSLLLYGIIRAGGRPLIERFPGFFMMPRKRRERLERVFQRPSGQLLVAFMRLIPLTRVLVSIPAGLAKMPVPRFLVYSTIGLTLYNAGFLWFAYEARRPGSEVETQAAQLQAIYVSPAWAAIQNNAIITGAIVVLVGIIVSAATSIRTIKDPEDAQPSMIGRMTNFALFWGGLALGAATFFIFNNLNELITTGGLDLARISDAVGYDPKQVLYTVAAATFLIGVALRELRIRSEGHRMGYHIAQRYIRDRTASIDEVPEEDLAAYAAEVEAKLMEKRDFPKSWE